MTFPCLQEEDDNPCFVCGSNHEVDKQVLCDACDKAHHLECVGLDEVPEGEWFCPACVENKDQKRKKEDDLQRARAKGQSEARCGPRLSCPSQS